MVKIIPLINDKMVAFKATFLQTDELSVIAADYPLTEVLKMVIEDYQVIYFVFDKVFDNDISFITMQ